MPTYLFKHYRRTKPGGTTGEMLKSTEVSAKGMAHASEIARRDYLSAVNFDTDFLIIEGDTGFVTCWFTDQDAQ